MKTTTARRFLALKCSILLGFACLAGAVRADTFTATFTNELGNGIWQVDRHIRNNSDPNDVEVPGNWSTGAYPSNGHSITDPNPPNPVIPGPNPLYNVVFGSGASCALTGGVTIQGLTLSAGSLLNVAPGGTLKFHTETVNDGNIILNPSASSSDASIWFDTSASFNVTQITGSGSIQLNGIDSFDAAIVNSNGNISSGGMITHGPNHRIHGRGDIFTGDLAAVWINHGPIEADVNGHALRMYWSGLNGNQNTAVMRALNGGILYFHGGRVNQGANAKIRAEDGSVVVLGEVNSANNHFYVTGGTLETTGTGVLEAGVLDADGVTNNGKMEVKPGCFITINSNGFVNNGTILLNTTGGTTDSAFGIAGNTVLSGTGRLQLNGPGQNDAKIYNPGFSFTQGANHKIHGQGDLDIDDGSSVFINNGILEADVNGAELRLFINGQLANANNNVFRASNGGTLFWEVGRLDQSGGGTISAEADSTVILGNRGFANNVIACVGGTLTTSGNGIIKASTVEFFGDVTNQGNLEMEQLFFSATKFTNNGTITNKATGLQVNFRGNSTIIDGTGSMILSNGINIQVQNTQDVINSGGHRIKGDGTFSIGGSASLTNNGIFAPGSTIGTIVVNGKFTQGNNGILEIDLAGTTPGTQYDQLVLNGPATLGGQLRINLMNGFFPSPADTFKVVDSNQNLTGGFLNVGSGERVNVIGGLGSFIVTYSGEDVILSSFGPAIAGGGLNLRLANPKMGGDNGLVTMTLVGTGAQQGATVILRRAGQPDLIAGTVTVSADGTTVTARFRLNGQLVGPWDVVITNPDTTSYVIAGGFTVEAVKQTRIWGDLLYRKLIRFNSASRFTVIVGNDGNTDAYGVPVFVSGIPSDAQVALEFGLMSIPVAPELPPEVNPGAFPPVINTANGKVLALIIPKIPAGGVASYQFTINVPTARTFNINAVALPPVLEAADIQSASRGKVYYPDSADSTFAVTINQRTLEFLGSLFTNGVDCLTSFVPGVDCLKALLALGNLGNTLSQMCNSDANDNGSVAISMAQLLYGNFTASLYLARCGSDLTPLGPLLDIVGCGLNLVSFLYDAASYFNSFSVTSVGAIDPNDKVGALGSGPPEQYLTGNEPFRYVVFFENVPNATAPAQHVRITDQLDVSKFDLDSFQLGPISFGTSTVLTPPAGLTQWIVDQDLRPAKNLIARVTANLDKSTGLITWDFYSLDPATMVPTTDPVAGFLPPNQTAPEGDGAVTFTINVKAGLATGTQVLNQAQVVFDNNAPINTPTWLNTIDNSPPASQVTTLPSTSSSSAINLSWSGSDNGGGIHHYAIYVSENGGAFTLWKNSTATSGLFQGRPNATYSFYSVAVDRAGNFEAPPGPADASTTTLTGRLLNIATRLQVQTGENVLIGGLIITGIDPKKVILRAIGPSLSQFFQGALADPVLDLYQGSTLIATNDNWRDSQQAEIEATGIPPSNTAESAIVQTLAPGSYTAVLSGKNGTTGIAVVEAYDLNQAAASQLANISSRGLVASGNNVMIGGVIAGGTNNADVRVLIRGIGPSLANAGIQGALQDPTLDLVDGNGTLVRANDNWQDTQQTEIQATSIPPSSVTESAIVATLTPGNYTAILRGKNDGTGVGLVEVYNVP